MDGLDEELADECIDGLDKELADECIDGLDKELADECIDGLDKENDGLYTEDAGLNVEVTLGCRSGNDFRPSRDFILVQIAIGCDEVSFGV